LPKLALPGIFLNWQCMLGTCTVGDDYQVTE